MNLYIFKGDTSQSAHGTAAVIAHNADEARRILSRATTDPVTLERYISLDRNPRAQLVTHYFE